MEEKPSVKESLDDITKEGRTKALEKEQALAKGRQKIRARPPRMKAKVKVPEVTR